MSIKGDCKIYLHWFSGRLALQHPFTKKMSAVWRNGRKGRKRAKFRFGEKVNEWMKERDESKREQWGDIRVDEEWAYEAISQWRLWTKRVVVTDFLMNQINVWLMMAWAVPTSAQSQWMSWCFLDYGYALPFSEVSLSERAFAVHPPHHTLSLLLRSVGFFILLLLYYSFLSQLQWNTQQHTHWNVFRW